MKFGFGADGDVEGREKLRGRSELWACYLCTPVVCVADERAGVFVYLSGVVDVL